MTNEDRASRPWNWPREWWIDEKFWRDVATRTVAGIISGAFLLLLGTAAAGAAGLISLPVVQSILIIFGGGILGLVFGISVDRIFLKGKRTNGDASFAALLIIMASITVFLLIAGFVNVLLAPPGSFAE